MPEGATGHGRYPLHSAARSTTITPHSLLPVHCRLLRSSTATTNTKLSTASGLPPLHFKEPLPKLDHQNCISSVGRQAVFSNETSLCNIIIQHPHSSHFMGVNKSIKTQHEKKALPQPLKDNALSTYQYVSRNLLISLAHERFRESLSYEIAGR